MINKEDLKNAIRSEGLFVLSDETLETFLSMGVYNLIPAKNNIISPGTIDKSIYITASGVTKAVFFDGKKEIVLGFSGPGTITMSPICFVTGKESFCGFQTITDCEIIKIEKSDFESLMLQSHEFSRWMFGIAIGQLCAFELKAQMLSEEDVASNYKMMVKRQMKLDKDGFDPNRPDILSIVSSKDLASYLGITQSYLSNIRKSIWKQERLRRVREK